MVAGVVAVVVSGLVVVDVVADRQRTARILAQPGGIHAITTSPKVIWERPLESAMVATVGGLAVVSWGDRLAAIDPADGSVAWSAGPLGGQTDCAPSADAEPIRSSTLVCVTTPKPGAESVALTPRPHVVRVFGADGAVASRRTITAEVVVAVSDHEVAQATPGVSGATVRVEDATSGELRWLRRVERAPVDRSWTVDENGDLISPPFAVWTWNGFIMVGGGGLTAAFDEAGGPVSPAEDAAVVVRLGDGMSLRKSTPAEDSVTEVVGQDGPRWRAEGRALAPMVTDGTTEDVVMIQEGGFTRAHDARSGRVRWGRLESSYETAVARVDTVLVLSRSSGIEGYDTQTGRLLWTHHRVPVGERPLTDGDRLVVSTVDPGVLDPHDTVTEAIDLLNGEVVWRYRPDGGGMALLGIGGRLVAIESHGDQGALVGLG